MRFSVAPDGRVFDSAPMAEGKPWLVYRDGKLSDEPCTYGEFVDSQPIIDEEAARLTHGATLAQYSSQS